MSSSRNNILNRLNQASKQRETENLEEPDFKAPIYLKSDKNMADWFRENLELVAGKVYCPKNLEAAVEQLQLLVEQENWEQIYCLDPTLQKAIKGKVKYHYAETGFENLQVGITPCEFLIAHLGSVMVSSSGASGRRLHVFPETHIVIAHKNQLVKYLDDAMEQIKNKYKDHLPSMITNITGPSRTADIEKTLVMGMHGPRKLVVFLCDEPF